MHADRWAAPTNLAGDVVAIERALNSHLLIAVDGTGAGGCVEVEAGVSGSELDGAGASFEFPVRCRRALDLDVARSGACAEAALHVFQFDTAGSCLDSHITLALGLFNVDVTRASVGGEAVLEAGRVDAAGARSEFGVLAHAVIFDVAGAGIGFEEGIGWRLDVIVDADVVVVLMALANADDVSGLIDGWIFRDLLDLFIATAAPVGFDAAEDVDAIGGAVGDVNVPGAGGDSEFHVAVDGEVALKGGFAGEDGQGCEGQDCCC